MTESFVIWSIQLQIIMIYNLLNKIKSKITAVISQKLWKQQILSLNLLNDFWMSMYSWYLSHKKRFFYIFLLLNTYIMYNICIKLYNTLVKNNWTNSYRS